jgi:hypothetical protein
MPGASQQTRRVKALNANWVAAGPDGGADGDDGRFEIMVVTEDDQRHAMPISPASCPMRARGPEGRLRAGSEAAGQRANAWGSGGSPSRR